MVGCEQSTRDLDAICEAIRSNWQMQYIELVTRIESIYKAAGINIILDPDDQYYYLSALYTIVAQSRPRHILQTGTYVGGSTLAMALALLDCGIDGIIDTIDPEPNRYGDLTNIDPVGIARRAVAAGGLSRYVQFHRGYSVMAWDSDRINITDAPEGVLYSFIDRRKTDLLVIDGDHTLNGTYWDMEVGARTMDPDGPGLIFVHDYNAIPSVREAVKYWKRRHSESLSFRGYSQRNGFALMQYRALPILSA